MVGAYHRSRDDEEHGGDVVSLGGRRKVEYDEERRTRRMLSASYSPAMELDHGNG